MKSILIAGLGLLAALSCVAQQEDKAFTRAYTTYSEWYITRSPFEAQKIDRLVKEAQADTANHGHALPDRIYTSLSIKEKFTYNMNHPESFFQICSGYGRPEENVICGRLPFFFWETVGWSRRQYDFFKANRDSVIAFIEMTPSTRDSIGLNYKRVIADIDAVELIPFLLESYQRHRDLQVLTVLMLLMNDKNYKPFTSSDLFKSIYADNKSSYRTGVAFSREKEQHILNNAKEFYKNIRK